MRTIKRWFCAITSRAEKTAKAIRRQHRMFWRTIAKLTEAEEWCIAHNFQVGAIAIRGLIDGLILAFVGLMFIFQFVPEMESAATTDNISNSFVAAMGDMAVWVIPVLGIVGVMYLGFRFIKGRAG